MSKLSFFPFIPTDVLVERLLCLQQTLNSLKTLFFLKPVNSIEYQPLYIEFIFTSEFVDLAIHPYPLGFSVFGYLCSLAWVWVQRWQCLWLWQWLNSSNHLWKKKAFVNLVPPFLFWTTLSVDLQGLWDWEEKRRIWGLSFKISEIN